ncbi:Deoxyhypusine synthase, partial [Coemansia sp. S610]
MPNPSDPTQNGSNGVPSIASAAVFAASSQVPKGTELIRGYDFDNGVDYNALLNSYATTGFQAASFNRAVEIINHMRAWRLSDEPINENDQGDDLDMEHRKTVRCKVFLGYTSNLVSCGVREIIKYLVKNKMVDVVVATAGGVEEDFIKCLAPTYVGKFNNKGSELRSKGLNRIGNLI